VDFSVTYHRRPHACDGYFTQPAAEHDLGVALSIPSQPDVRRDDGCLAMSAQSPEVSCLLKGSCAFHAPQPNNEIDARKLSIASTCTTPPSFISLGDDSE